MVWAGIDPGLTGCVAVIDPDAAPGERLVFHDTPVEYITGAKGRTRIIPAGCADIILSLPSDCMFTIEQQWARPHARPMREGETEQPQMQGALGAFGIAYSYGLWKGILAACGSTYREVSPQSWKNCFLSKHRDKGDKSVSIRIAQQIYPHETDRWLYRQKDHNRADALLIGEYGKRVFYAQSTLLEAAAAK